MTCFGIKEHVLKWFCPAIILNVNLIHFSTYVPTNTPTTLSYTIEKCSCGKCFYYKIKGEIGQTHPQPFKINKVVRYLNIHSKIDMMYSMFPSLWYFLPASHRDLTSSNTNYQQLFFFQDWSNFVTCNRNFWVKSIWCSTRPPKVRSQNQGYAQYLIKIKRKIRSFPKTWPNSLKFLIKIMFIELLSF